MEISSKIYNFQMWFLLKCWFQIIAAKKKGMKLSFCHKLWFYICHIFSTWWCKPLIFQTIIIWSKMSHSLKYLRSPTIKCKDIWIRKYRVCDKNSILCRMLFSWRYEKSDTELNGAIVNQKCKFEGRTFVMWILGSNFDLHDLLLMEIYRSI